MMDEMVFYYPQGHEAHYQDGHPERPDRVEAIRDAFKTAGWWNQFPQLSPIAVSEEVLQAVHTPGYVKRLEDSCQKGQRLDMDTYTTTASWELALNAAGGALSVAASVWHRKTRRGFALTRPPGHHATANRGMGFCLLNNVALAVEHLLQCEGAQRLAIVDLDLHHGNGTQDIFYHRPDVFYFSTHQSPLYPGSGRLDETGEGPGIDCTANFPLPPGSGDQAFGEIMGDLILPLLDRFDPEMILVSFGFDTHWRDPLGQLQLSAEGYGKLITSLAGWADERANGRLALFLEGGYDLDAGAACGAASVAALINQPWQDNLGPSPRPEGKSWQQVVRRAKEIWTV